MIRSGFVLPLCLLPLAGLWAEETKGKQVTVLVEGAHCDACLSAVRTKLASVKGVRLEPDDVYRGQEPKYFSDPFVVRLGKTSATGLGALAKATAKSKTPHAEDIPPRLHLVLYSEITIDESSVSALRMALSQTNGLLVFEAGGLGAFPNKGRYWIRLDPAGGAELHEIVTAAKQAGTFKLLDPSL